MFGNVKITPWASNSKEAECDDADMQFPFAFAWKCALLAVRRKRKGRPSGELRKGRGIEAILQMRCGTSEGEKQPDDLLEWRCKGRNVEFQMVLNKCNPKTQTRTTRNFKRVRLGTASSKFSRRTDSICATGSMKWMVFLVYEASRPFAGGWLYRENPAPGVGFSRAKAVNMKKLLLRSWRCGLATASRKAKRPYLRNPPDTSWTKIRWEIR